MGVGVLELLNVLEMCLKMPWWLEGETRSQNYITCVRNYTGNVLCKEIQLEKPSPCLTVLSFVRILCTHYLLHGLLKKKKKRSAH